MAALASHSGLTARPKPLAGRALLGRFLPDLAGALVAPALFGACLSRANASSKQIAFVSSRLNVAPPRAAFIVLTVSTHLPDNSVVSPSTTEGFEPCANGICFFVNRTGHAS